MTQSTEIAKVSGNSPATAGNIAQYLKQRQGVIATAAASNINAEQICRQVWRTVDMEPRLQACSCLSVFQSLLMAVELGLQVGSGLGEAYLVPFGKVCTFVPGYKGISTLAYRSGLIEDIAVRTVYRDDVFEIELGTEEKLVHKPCMTGTRKDEDIVCFYTIVRVRGSAKPHFDYMTLEEVKKIQRNAPGGNSPAWKDHFAEQGKKTCLKRTLKVTPKSVEMSKAICWDNAVETRSLSAAMPFDAEDLADLPLIEEPKANAAAASLERERAAAARKKAEPAPDLELNSDPDPSDLVPADQPTLDTITKLCGEKNFAVRNLSGIAGAELHNLNRGQARTALQYLEALD